MAAMDKDGEASVAPRINFSYVDLHMKVADYGA
jgi:hypothetical protein